ncbi:MAG: response regulator [Luteolibacter sp.]
MPPETPSLTPVKFLLVDDLEANLLALEALLRKDGLELLKAQSGQEALELMLVHEISLAFIDVQMPGMSGFELAEIMRSTERTRRTPIIFLTAATVDSKRRIRSYETGAIDFLPKPIEPAMLLNKAEVFFQLARQRQELQESERRLREANDRLERADRSKDEFLAMLAHELRNPLAPMLTGIDILLADPADPGKVGKISDMMKRQLGQMAHLIDDLLDVARITTGKVALSKAAISIRSVIDQALESVAPLMESFQHELIVEAVDRDWTVDADYHRLTQVVSNLLTNAAKYTPPFGKIVLSIDEKPSGMLRISVKDNGKGISKEHQARIFELFDQGACGPKDGLGIGLTLVKSLVEMHGGTISVESEGRGKGSEFVIGLPLVETSPIPASGTPEPVSGKQESLRILVADDGKSTADILGLFFQMEGMETSVVYDGHQAVLETKRFLPQLACLDLGMPVVDGYEAARQLKEACPEIYLVALSGWGSAADREKTASAGFHEHLVKPVSPEQLRELLRRVTTWRNRV